MPEYVVRKMEGGFGVFDAEGNLAGGPMSRAKARETCQGLNAEPEGALEAPETPAGPDAPTEGLPPVTAHYGPMAKDNFGHLARTAPTDEARAYWQAKADAL